MSNLDAHMENKYLILLSIFIDIIYDDYHLQFKKFEIEKIKNIFLETLVMLIISFMLIN